MVEIEDQLARLAAHRAAQVTPFSTATADELARRRVKRPTWLVTAVAASVAVALVVGGWLLFSGTGDSPSVTTPAAPTPATAPASTPTPSTLPTPTATTSVAPPPCPALDGADVAAKSQSPGAVSSGVLGDVQASATDCTDVVTFSIDGAPGFTVGYEPGPFTLDPSDRPATVDGNAFVVVKFEHTSGPDLTSRDIHPGAGEVREVRELQDFEGVTTWVIGLDTERPFRIVSGAGSFAIEFGVIPGS
jgi:hypothetical protein